MSKPTETGTTSSEQPKPKPIDDPLAQAIENFADEVEPVAIPAEDALPPATSEGDPPPTS
jgi:hypothetical protein